MSLSVSNCNRYNIDSHDYSVRLRAAKRFLSDGDKVKTIYFIYLYLLCMVLLYFSLSKLWETLLQYRGVAPNAPEV